MSKTLSTNSHPKLSNKLLFGSLLLIAGFGLALAKPALASTKREVLDAAVNKAHQEPKQELAQLTSLSRLTLHSVTAQRALASYYQQQGRGDLAADALANSRPQLLLEASAAATTSYDFERSLKYANQIGKKDLTTEGKLLQATALLNLNQVDEGCKLVGEVTNSNLENSQLKDLQAACEILQKRTPTRAQAYELYKLGIPLATEGILAKLPHSSGADYITLASIYAKQGRGGDAAQKLQAAYAVNPYDPALNAAIEHICMPSVLCGDLAQKYSATKGQLPNN